MAMLRLTSLVALVCASLVARVSAQNPWVNRRRNRDSGGKADSGVAPDVKAPETDFSKLNDLVGAGGAGGGLGDVGANMAGMWEELLDSPEMEQMLADPELLAATIKNNPLIGAIPGAADQVEALLASDTFKDPAKLREAMKTGVEAMSAVGAEFGKQLGATMELAQKDPAAFQKQMAEAVAQLVPGAGADGGAAIMEAAKAMFDGSGGAADLEKLAQIPGMEGLGDPEQFKAQMASYQKMMAQMGMDPAAMAAAMQGQGLQGAEL